MSTMSSADPASSHEEGPPQRKNGHHRWIATFEGGTERVIHASVLIGDFIYVFGGCRLENLNYEHEPIEILSVNTKTFQWRILEPTKQPPDDVPFMRYGHTVVEYKGNAYLFSGRSSFRFCDKLFRYDPVAHFWERVGTHGSAPVSVLGHSMNVVGDMAYVYGGLDNALNTSTGDMYLLDFTTFGWSRVQQVGERPTSRYFHTASVIERKIYIFGGQTRGGRADDHEMFHCNKIHCFDTDSHTWHRPEQQGNVPSGRRSHAAFVYEGRLYVHGGHSDRMDESYGDMHRFNPDNGEWEFFPIHVGAVEIPPSRRSHTTVLAGDRVFMIGGVTILRFEKNLMETEENSLNGELCLARKNFFVLDMKPSLKTLCMTKVIQNGLDQSSLPQNLRTEMSRMFTVNDIVPASCREQ